MSNERSPRGLSSTTIGTSGMRLSFRQLGGCQSTIATSWLSKERAMAAWREIEIEATPEEVWEALATEEGRDRWLDEPGREIHVESRGAAPPPGLVVVGGRRAADARRVPRRRGAGRDARAGQRDRAAGAARPPGREHGGRPGVTRRHRAGPRRARRPDAPPRRRDPPARGLDERAGAHRLAADDPPGGGQAPRRARRGRPGRAGRRAAPGECSYRLRPGALAPAASWMGEAAAAWDARLGRLKGAVEGRGSG